jgi:Tfp pilus assembly protein PilO
MTGRDRMVVIAIAVLVLIAAGWELAVSPERKKANTLNTQVAAAQSALSSAETQLSSAKAAQSKYAAAYSDVVSLGKAVPAENEVPGLIYELTSATNQRNVEFNSITAAGAPAAGATAATPATTAATSFTQMPFSFTFSGGFFQLEKLFRQLTSFTTHASNGGLQVSGRLLTIQSIKLAPEAADKGGAPRLSSAISATAYVLPSGTGLTAGATATSPTGATVPAATGSATPATSAAVVKVTP